MNYETICLQCFHEKPAADKPCPKCGCVGLPVAGNNCLFAGTLLNNRYIVGTALGIGGFGITYKCFDTVQGGVCAIKEFFPASIASRAPGAKEVSVSPESLDRYNKIKASFSAEAKLLENMHHPNIITVYNRFSQNNTEYYAMEYCDGVDLRRYTGNFSRRLEYDEGMNLLFQIMNGMEAVHSQGVLHRDIAPDNIYITKGNNVKILDFGAARRAVDGRNLSVIVKVGYAPIEQYGKSEKQGPYTDIYALGATFYHLFTSKMPVESTKRVGVSQDPLVPFSQLRPDLPDPLKYCIERAMNVTPRGRIQNIAEMKNILGLSNVPVSKIVSKEKPSHKRIQSNSGLASQYVSQPSGKADISRRMGAYAIDMLLWGFLYMIFALVGTGTGGVVIRGGGIDGQMIALLAIYPFAAALFGALSEILTGTTPGKAMLGLYVASKSGGKADAGQIFIRNAIKILGFLVAVLGKNGNFLQDQKTDTDVFIK